MPTAVQWHLGQRGTESEHIQSLESSHGAVVSPDQSPMAFARPVDDLHIRSFFAPNDPHPNLISYPHVSKLTNVRVGKRGR